MKIFNRLSKYEYNSLLFTFESWLLKYKNSKKYKKQKISIWWDFNVDLRKSVFFEINDFYKKLSRLWPVSFRNIPGVVSKSFALNSMKIIFIGEKEMFWKNQRGTNGPKSWRLLKAAKSRPMWVIRQQKIFYM